MSPPDWKIASLLPRILLPHKNKDTKCFIHRLPSEVYVHGIFPYLALDDMLALRSVDKAFFLLTHEPHTWKRFLRCMNVPHAPLRPTLRNTITQDAFEVEQLVTRAISVEQNWRSERPKLHHSKELTALYKVLEMKLVAGGKYLVASMTDGEYRFFIMVYCIEFPSAQLCRPLARYQLRTKAFNLQARYMKFQGQQGIMISFLGRRIKANSRIRFPVNVNEFGWKTQIDPDIPMMYDLSTIHIDLEALESLSDPYIPHDSVDFRRRVKMLKPPFIGVSSISVESPVVEPTLFIMDNMPHLSVVAKPADEIVYINLESRVFSTFHCTRNTSFTGFNHIIKTIRYVPSQRELIVIRTIAINGAFPALSDLQVIETYTLPSQKVLATCHRQLLITATDRVFIEKQTALTFQMSEILDHEQDTTFAPNQVEYPPPPISIFLRTEKPTRVLHYNLSPDKLPAAPAPGQDWRWHYTLNYVCSQTTHDLEDTGRHMYVLPGIVRAITYSVPKDDRTDTPKMINLRRYFNPDNRSTPYTYEMRDYTTVGVLREDRKLAKPVRFYRDFAIPTHLRETMADEGMGSITWDEGIGRICLVTAKDPLKIHILDFSNAETPDERLEKWRHAYAIMYGTENGRLDEVPTEEL